MRFRTPTLLAALMAVLMDTSGQQLERSAPDCADEAVARAREGAARGDPASIYLMARHYSSGKCLKGDGEKAVAMYWKAAELGYPPAYYNLGMIHAARQKFEDAETLFFGGTQLGHRGCELQLGILYSLVPPPVGNDEKAYAWLSMTASRAEPIAPEAADRLRQVSARMSSSSAERAKALEENLRKKYFAVQAFQAK